MKPNPRRDDARSVALAALMKGGDSAVELDREIERAALEPRDRAFATELAYGTTKMQRSLAWSVSRFLNRPFVSLDHRLRWVLLLGAYQLLHLERVPAHSAVDESVRLAAAGGHRGIAGLANAVLRRVASERPMPPVPTENDGAAALADYASLPDWIAAHLIARFGFPTALAAARGINAAPRRAIRINSPQNAELALGIPHDRYEEGSTMKVDPYTKSRYGIPECRVVPATADMASVRELVRSGAASWQSEESQLAVHILDPQPGETVLDVCCGRGVKTLMIANRLGGKGAIWSLDDDARKLADLSQSVARSPNGAAVHPVVADVRAQYPSEVPHDVDAALVDAPCSGLGIIGRRADARWRKREGDPARFSDVQRQALARAADAVRVGGRLLYVTCSTHPAENEAVVDAFLADRPHWHPVAAWPNPPDDMRSLGDYRLTVPGLDGADGFFYALLRRTG